MPPPYRAAQIGTLFQRDDRSLVEKYGRNAAPFFRLEISDQNNDVLFSAESQVQNGNYDLQGLIISEVSWDENDCQADEMRLTVQNIDLTLHDSRLFAEGNSIDLWMGYDGHQPDYMGRAVIVEIAPQFTSDAIPTMGITAYDISHFMSEEGRAEVVAEGTRWWEARTAPVDTEQTDSRGTIHTGVASNPAELAQRQREARSLGIDVSLIPPRTITGGAPSPDGTPIRVIQAPSTNASDETTRTPRTRTTFQRVRNPRRRNRRGKVWRNKTDNEIAEAIFMSYGIVPYTEATNERARASRETITNDRVVRTVSTHMRNLREEAEQEQEQERQAGTGLERIIPDVTVDTSSGRSLNLSNTSIRIVAVRDNESFTIEIAGRRVVQKAGTSDMEFLKKMAATHDYIVFVFYHYETGSWIGYFGSKRHVPQRVSYTFQYAEGDDTTLASITPKISTKGQKSEIDMLYVDPVSGREHRLRVSMENISSYSPEFRGPDGLSHIEEPLGSGPEVTLTIHGQRTAVVANRRFTSLDDARRWLMSFWIRYASEFCEADGQTIIGLPELRGRQRHSITGVGRFSGDYFVTKATHKMGSGTIYVTTFSGYRMVAMLESEAQSEDERLSVESDEIGQLTPEARGVLARWREALATS